MVQVLWQAVDKQEFFIPLNTLQTFVAEVKHVLLALIAH